MDVIGEGVSSVEYILIFSEIYFRATFLGK